jgi:hypothetical protein
MNIFTSLRSILVITGILSLFIAAGCNDNGGGDNPFPPPNSLAISVAQRGETTPDGQATFFGFIRLTSPSSNGLVGFVSIERVTEDTNRLLLYLADASGLMEVVRNGESAPGGGIFRDVPENIGVNDQAQIAFVGRTAESPDDEFGDTDGYYLGGGDGIKEFVREGDSVPGGGTVFKLCIPGFLACAYRHGGINESGQITFVAALKDTPGGDSDNRALYFADSSGITQLVRKGDPAPGGNGAFEDFFDPAGPNSHGQVAFIGRISGSSGGENDNEAIYLASAAGITELARKGEPAPGGGGGTLDSINNLTNPNESGEVAFNASIRNGVEDVPIDSGIFLARASGIVKLIRTRDPGPGGIGQFSGFRLGKLNDSGQVIFRSRLFEGKKSAQGLYRVGPESSVTTLAQAFQPAPPDGSKLYVTIDDAFLGPNNSGLSFFRATLMNADRTSTKDNIGVFLAQ